MRLLVLGGTAFVGRALVEDALARGWAVTTFNRGRTGRDHPDVEAVHGDRTVAADLEQLRGRAWDAVVDTCGYVPRDVLATAELLAPQTAAYAFVSTIGVYHDWPDAPVDEAAPLFDCPPDAGPDDGDYGTLKAGCERAVVAACGIDGSLLLRPGVILGPYENVGRLPWWLRRIAEGGPVLAPGPDPQRPMQLVDARDLAAFTLDALTADRRGPYNVVSRPGAVTYGRWLGACVQVTGSGAELVWVDDQVLLDAGVEPWQELPLWMPPAQSPYAWGADVERAHADRLRGRPIEDTVRDTWAWLSEGGDVGPQPLDRPGLGIDRDKEQRILATWLAARRGS